MLQFDSRRNATKVAGPGTKPADSAAESSRAAAAQTPANGLSGSWTTVNKILLRLPLLALGMVALLMALWAGLFRLGWVLPALQPNLPANHGPLMVSGFLGTLISLERAVALRPLWAYAAPLATGVGALALIAEAPHPLGPTLLTVGSFGLTALSAFIAYSQPALFTFTIGTGAVVWLVGNGLWLLGWPLSQVVPWWAGFLVLTIAGERLDLSRLRSLPQRGQIAFLAAVGLFLVGLGVSSVRFEQGVRLVGMGLIALALWLLRYDIAWRTVRQTGLPRFIAVSLLLGYAWLVVGGVLTLVFGDTPSGPYRDAMLHAIFLGFVFAMIFAHAPIIFPSILTVPITFRSAFYAPLVLLHLSLVLRIGSDLGSWESARQWGGLLNVMAVLLFFGMMVRSLDKRGFARTQGADKGPLRTSRLRLARLPIHFFTAAVTFFGLGVVIAPWVVSDLVDFFYHPWLLAVTHIFTLGWITSTMMGVMYRYVPALTKNPLRFPRLASVQFTLFVIGVAGMVAHFVIGIWPGLWSAAAVVVLSVFFFAANMVPCLAPVRSRGVAESGMLLSILLLLIAAVLGLLLGLDKTFNFLGGNLIANLAGHAHLAALGWVSLTICAVSYRMIPAFLLPEVQLPRGAMWQLYGLAAAVAGLAVALLSGSSGTSFWGVAIVLGLLSYVAVLVSLVHSRCMPIDWTVRHAMAGVLWLVVSAGLGLSLIMIDPGSALGNRIAGAYGTLGLLGWVTNFIVGMSYQLFPGFVAGVRTAAGWPPLTITELSLPRYRPFVFFSLNLGDLVLASGLLMAQVELARLGAGTIAVGGVVYVAVMLWTLRYAYRRSVPAAARNPLRVLPGDSVNL